MIPEEQIESIKQQILKQIESTLPESQKSVAISQIQDMNSEQLEEFLKQNNTVRQSPNQGQGGQCIFCSIVFNDIPSTKIGENEKAIAILEINPISKGHALIIPKEHIPSEDKLPKEAKDLAEAVAKKIKKLSPKKIDVIPSNLFGHEILNVLPVYNNETLQSGRQQTKKEGLEDLQKQLFSEKKKPKTEKKPGTKKIKDEKIWLPKRIP